MRRRFSARSRGVALIMVLMITGILGLLMLQIGLTSREHVARAQLLLDRAEASLRLQSRESAMLFTLMTQEWTEGKADETSANPYVTKWNFRGEVFEVDGARYRIQDVNGLFPMPQPGDSVKGFERLLVELGVTPRRAERVAAQFKSFQELDRDIPAANKIPLQAFGELRGVVDLTREEFDALEKIATLYPIAEINPETASVAYLAVRFDGGVLDGIRHLRASRGLDALSFWRLDEKGADDLTVFYPGPALRYDIEVRVGEIAFRRESTVVVKPYDIQPVVLWGRRRLNSEGSIS